MDVTKWLGHLGNPGPIIRVMQGIDHPLLLGQRQLVGRGVAVVGKIDDDGFGSALIRQLGDDIRAVEKRDGAAERVIEPRIAMREQNEGACGRFDVRGLQRRDVVLMRGDAIRECLRGGVRDLLVRRLVVGLLFWCKRHNASPSLQLNLMLRNRMG